MEQRVAELEKRVAELEKALQERPVTYEFNNCTMEMDCQDIKDFFEKLSAVARQHSVS